MYLILKYSKKTENRDNISLLFLIFNFGEKYIYYFIKELECLNDLEKDYGLLNSIGIKFELTKEWNDCEIGVYIKAPENLPNKNGVFNFILKFSHYYPEYCPRILLKTKIIHIEVDHNGYCYIKFLTCLNKENVGLFLILNVLYEFFW